MLLPRNARASRLYGEKVKRQERRTKIERPVECTLLCSGNRLALMTPNRPQREQSPLLMHLDARTRRSCSAES
jgi:hypothetical protein